MVKNIITITLILLTLAIPVTAGNGVRQLGSFELGGIIMKDTVYSSAFEDPQNKFVTCYVASIKSGNPFALADPSNTSIACRQTGNVKNVNKAKNPSVFAMSKSIGLKTMNVGRLYDAQSNTLVYIAYTTKKNLAVSRQVPLCYKRSGSLNLSYQFSCCDIQFCQDGDDFFFGCGSIKLSSSV